MEQTWRWYGPEDPVSLNDIRQAGATGIVTALHHIANGDVWPEVDIIERKKLIEDAGLRWSVVESIPVHEDIKRQCGDYERYSYNYGESIKHLAKHGIDTVCYNFMPVLDWTRTDLAYQLPDGSRALRFDQVAFSAFDLCILKRENAEADYSAEEINTAKAAFAAMTDREKTQLTTNIIAGLPGAEESYTLDDFRHQLASYKGIDKQQLRKHLSDFLRVIIPICENVGTRLAIHPDDPPRPLFGLPRIVSTRDDIAWLTSMSDSLCNGITMCTGSYGVRSDNDLVSMIREFGDRIYFAHLRATQREENPMSFFEAAHLYGDVDMYAVTLEILKEEQKREKYSSHRSIPIRPDHGHQILDDLKKQARPGYSAIGRLKGLAEIRGLEMAIKRGVLNKD